MKAQLLEDIGNSHPPLPPPMPPHAAQVAAGPDSNTASSPPAQSVPRPAVAATGLSAATASAQLPPQAAPDRLARWGRRAASGAAVLLLVLTVCGAGLWWYQERKVDQALSVLARAPMPARQATSTSASTALAQASDPQAAPHALPPTMPVAPAATEPPQPVAATPPRLTDDQDQDQHRNQVQNPAPAIVAAPEVMRKHKPAARAGSASTAGRSGQGNTRRSGPLAETLRLCRAAGYHAAQCVQLDCTATQYGLACKGARNVQR